MIYLDIEATRSWTCPPCVLMTAMGVTRGDLGDEGEEDLDLNDGEMTGHGKHDICKLTNSCQIWRNMK